MEATRNGARGAELGGRQIRLNNQRQGPRGERYAAAEHTLVVLVGIGVAWHRATIARD